MKEKQNHNRGRMFRVFAVTLLLALVVLAAAVTKMGLFDGGKGGKAELNDEKKWNRMWELWSEGKVDSPYAELMTYQSEVYNGGHDQYFTNTELTGDLQESLAALKTILPAEMQSNLQRAYDAYMLLEENEAEERAEEVLTQCDDAFYENEEQINNILQAYADGIA